MLLSNFTHRRQRHESDCLVACVEMVLTYLEVPTSYDSLSRKLQTRRHGTPFGNVSHLTSLGLVITLDYDGDLNKFEQTLLLGLPVLANVRTIGWDHWQGEETYHAVVVVGLDQATELIYIHDPFFAEAPIELNLTKFMIGWEEQRRQYAVISLAPME